ADPQRQLEVGDGGLAHLLPVNERLRPRDRVELHAAARIQRDRLDLSALDFDLHAGRVAQILVDQRQVMMARAEQDAVLLRASERPSLFGHFQDDGRGDGDPAGVDRHVYGRDLAALDADGPLYRAGGTVD